jgi:hypothetical protein
MSSFIDLSTDEFSLLSDPDILIKKKIIQNKIYKLLENTQTKIEVFLGQFEESLPANFSHAKISQGENYLNLPYMVLDYPSVFSKQNTFAFRTMFYWGNFFSNTLHLQGEYLEKTRQQLYAGSGSLINSNTYISTGETPWHYHYEADNYMPLTQENCDKLLSDKFVKLSTKIELNNWQKLPDLSADYLQKLMQIIAN